MGELVAEDVVAELTDADPGLGDGAGILGVQGGLGGEAVEGEGNKMRNAGVGVAEGGVVVASSGEEGEEED